MPPAVCVQAESKLFLGAAMPMGANVKPTEDGLFLDLSVPKSAKKSSHGHLCEQAGGKEVGYLKNGLLEKRIRWPQKLSLSGYGLVSDDGSVGMGEVWMHVRITVHVRQ